MTVAASCLDRASLQSLLEHSTDLDEIERVAAHLETCARCGETVESLLVSDSLGADLRGANVEADEPSVRQLRARLAKLRPAHTSQETTTGEHTHSGASPPLIETTKNKSVSLAPPQQPDEIGRLGGYRLLAELGRGGMGVVYKAEDLKLKRLVALKVMAPSLAADAAARQRFLREAVAMAAVHHDNIVVIHAVDEDNGVPFLAMEFLQGMPMDKWLKGGRKATPAQVLKLGREIAEGLAAAHERGLIHRDIKPGNIWLDSAHKGRVKILDFGLARSGTEDVHLTQSGAIVGTPAFMSPEQARGEKVDGRCDLFSLGCVLYKLCTGAMPFVGDTTMGLLMSLALDHPKTVRELNPEMPVALSDLVARLLAKKPEDRPQTAREVIQAINHVKEGRAAGFIPAGLSDPAGINPAARLETASRTESVTAPLLPEPASDGRKRPPWVIAAVATGFLATAILVGIVIIIRDKDGKPISQFKLPPGTTAEIRDDEKKGDAAVAPKPTADDAWIKEVAVMPADKQVEAVAARLKELNPGFDGKVTPTLEGGVVTGLDCIVDNVTDISSVRALKELRTLRCAGSDRSKGRLADLSPLKGMKLTSLYCDRMKVLDLSPLMDMPLTQLSIFGTQVSDLSPLKGMLLTDLGCDSTPVSDLSPLKGMPLTELRCQGTPVSALSPLKGMPLTHLICFNTKVSDLSPLKGMPLTCLHCGGTEVSDLSPLKDMPLASLSCDGTKVSDLSPLKGMPLTGLNCASTRVTDLSPLKELPLRSIGCDFKAERDAEILRSIKTLESINGKPVAEFWKEVDASSPKSQVDEAWVKQVAAMPAEKQVEAVAAKLKELNPGFDGKVKPAIENGVVKGLEFVVDDVTDISPIRPLQELRTLRCAGSGWSKGRLVDLSPLKSMKLTFLNCNYTKVFDLSPLKDMPLTEFYCYNVPLSDLSPLKNLKLTLLDCSYTSTTDLSPLKDMPLTNLSCFGAPVSNLAPLKGVPLISLNCGNTAYLSDLSPLKDILLKNLNCDFDPKRDAEILRSIKTLETINGKPAAEFWKEVDAKKP